MKIPFDISKRPQIESGEYTLETRDGNRARIICWDREDNDKQPLVALVKKRCCEVVIYTKINGEYLGTYGHGYDLFIVTPEPERTEFEQESVNFFNESNAILPDKDGVYNRHDCEELLHKSANKLLTIAREELVRQGYVIEKKAFHDAVEKIDDKHKAEMSIEYSLHCKIENRTRHAVMNWQEFQELAQKFINIGKDEALKDLPRWIPNKFDKHNFETCKAYLDTPRYLCYQDKMIDVSDLVEKLPKEDEK